MTQTAVRLRPGDLVEVKAPEEILQTLDADGTLGQLPFMPEMVEFCGKRFLVSKRVLKTCYYTEKNAAGFRKFKTDDVVLLDGLRCSGAEHDGCQKACMIFWREAWLRKVQDAAVQTKLDAIASERLRARLKTSTGPKTYFCQASELLKPTHPLSQRERFEGCLTEVFVGNCSILEMAQRIGRWLFWRTRRKLLGEFAHGPNKSTPAESLNLQSGELIEVKSMESINQTLDETGHNRGLFFFPDMHSLCGKQRRVERRIEKIIVDGTGEMRQLRNTVYLENSHCGCVYALTGCPRGEFSYWREIWLRRSGNSH
ncbi:MAG TPA: hypothetical protein VEI52_03505 [Terriglobales bacterium]|nr:hypothetical protein [Terriglobales bacterium]